MALNRMKKTYSGSCHCGAVRYNADIDLSEETFKCNCSKCTKSRNWLAVVKPDAFRLSAGESALTDYRFGKKTSHHLFCKHCGVSSFLWGDDKNLGGKFYAVNLACIDNATANELINAPVTYVDGQHDNYKEAPAEVQHL
jgi:hypothetical protein